MPDATLMDVPVTVLTCGRLLANAQPIQFDS